MTLIQNGLELVTAPTSEPVQLDTVKSHLNIDDAAEDSLLESYIAAAREWVERYLDLALITRVLRLNIHQFPSTWLSLPFPPLGQVSSIKYIDTSGVEQTVSPSIYQVNNLSIPACVVLLSGESWPLTLSGLNRVKVEYEAGFGSDHSAIPKLIQQALLLTIGHYYVQREEVSFNALREAPQTARDLVSSFRRVKV